MTRRARETAKDAALVLFVYTVAVPLAIGWHLAGALWERAFPPAIPRQPPGPWPYP